MDLVSLLEIAVEKKASDIFFIAGKPVAFRLSGKIEVVGENTLSVADVKEYVDAIYTRYIDSNPSRTKLAEKSGDDDFSISVPKLGRFRANIYKQRGSYAAVLRVVSFALPDYKEMGIPDTIINLSKKNKGLILVTGSAGSGKSTTLACVIDKINNEKNSHIITLEDPIEYIHPHKSSLVSQREVSEDTESYLTALRAALRQSPNVIFLGEMRDFETISMAMTAAETGQLLLSTLHTISAAHTVDRIIDVFPPAQQQQVRLQLSMALEAVISQQLLPTVDGKLVAAFEILLVNSAVRNLIREAKNYQLNNLIMSSAAEGMISMDASILQLYDKKVITAETVRQYCHNYEFVSKKIN